MARGEDQPQPLIADIVIEGCVPIRHRLLLPRHVARQHVVGAGKHLAAAQMIERAALRSRHQPRAGLVRDARGRQDSSAASNASWVSSSASGTSRSIRDSVVISRGCSMRQAARIARSMSAEIIAPAKRRLPAFEHDPEKVGTGFPK